MAKRKYTDAQLAQILDMRERGRSIGQISLKVGLSEGSVSYLCLKFGADSPHLKGKVKPVPTESRSYMRNGFEVRSFTQVEDKQILGMRTLGLSPHQIGKALGRQHNSIEGRLMTLARMDERMEALS